MDEIAFDRSHGGASAGASIIDFSVSINPFGPPPGVLEAYHRAASTIGSYPEPYAATLTAAIAVHLGVAPGNILAGNGSTQLLYLIARVLRPKHPFVVIPTFSEIANSLLTLGAVPAPILLRRERRYQLDLGEVEKALAQGADALFLGRPNSPTGSTIDLAVVSAIAERSAARRCWCVIDEAFIDLADDPASAVDLIRENPRLAVTRSMTKLYAIPGLRLGYLAASEDAVAAMARALEPWSVSGPATAAGLACLRQSDSWHAEIRDALKRERTYVETELAAIPGFTVFAAAANFLMFEAPRPESFSEHMLGCGIVVRDLAKLPGAGPGLFRIGVRGRADNDRLLQAARAWR